MISVILPVFNCEKYLDDLLSSLWTQTYQDFEVICVNDGSTDNTLSVLIEVQKNHPNLKVITIENSGPSASRNVGIEESHGEYLCFIDSDDRIESTYLQDLVETAEKTKAELTVCHIDRIYEYKRNFLEKHFNYIQNYSLENVVSIEQFPELLVQIMNAPFAKLIKKEFLLEHQIRFKVGRIAQDLLFTKTILLKGAKVAVCPKVNYHYLVRKGSITTGMLDKASDIAFIFDEVIQTCTDEQLQRYHDELEYLCVYHVGIDMTYRMFKAGKPLFECIKTSRQRLKKYNYSITNKYIKKMNWFVRIYLYLFFAF